MGDISELIGLTMQNVFINAEKDEIHFYVEGGRYFKMYHTQSGVITLRAIYGHLNHLINVPILKTAEVIHKSEDPPNNKAWTLYRFETKKGSVSFRWNVNQNRQSSEHVSFDEMR